MTDSYTTRVRKYGAAMAAALGEQEQMERFAAQKKDGGCRDHATFEDWRAWLISSAPASSQQPARQADETGTPPA